jgi:hypothetical protein
MTLYRWTRGLAMAAVLPAVLTGCIAAKVKMTTNKASDYVQEPKRLFVVESLGNGLGTSSRDFQKAFQDMIRTCGVEADFYARTLALDASDTAVQREQTEHMRNFRPDTILSLRELSYMQRGSRVTQITYGLDLSDVKTRRTVWKDQVILSPGVGSDGPLALGREIRNRLETDGILRSCSDAKS